MEHKCVKYRISLDQCRNENFKFNQLNHTYIRYKRRFEVFFIGLMSPVVLLISAIVAIAIRIESKGPVLFTQIRPGKNGKQFKMYKFRSMKPGSEKVKALTSGQDHRITRVGKFIRKYRLDELPQLWNVLKGEMSVIGPRPEPSFLSDEIERKIPLYTYRRIVAPGITGLAQVELGYTESIDSVIDKLEYDLYYINYLSFYVDLLILYKTIYVVVAGHGAR